LGHTKGALAGQQFIGQANLPDGIQAFLDEIQKSEVERVFHHWIERVRWVLDHD
jgi:ABC-type iron transport system FetAB ATPase subunit